MVLRRTVALLLLVVSVAVHAQRVRAVRPQQPRYDWSRVEATLASFVPSTVPGLTFMLVKDGAIVYARSFGTFTLDTVVPIASATKMPTCALVMTLVDEGKLDLDVPVSTYLQGHVDWPADKAAITTRMLLNHTAGMDDSAPCLDDRFTTLKACTQQIANIPLRYAPGTRFSYGGNSMQVAGYVAEVVSGKSWRTLFEERIGAPLGLTRFSYGISANPRIAGGAVSDAGDYTRLLRMMLAGGVWDGRRILSETAVASMEVNQIAGLPKDNNPGGSALPGYSFGWWHSNPLLHPGSAGPELSDQGAFGATPWIDRDVEYGAIILIFDRTATGSTIWTAVRPLIVEQLD